MEWLYPRRCPICDGLLLASEPVICRTCAKKVAFLTGPRCMTCGMPLDNDQAEYCRGCRAHAHVFERSFAPFAYGGAMQASLMRFKYGRRPEYARFYAAAIAAYGRRLLQEEAPQLILPVPIYGARYRARGYNQAEVLAAELSKRLQVPYAGDLLYRARRTQPQKNLTASARRQNLRGAFRVSPGTHLPDRVLLVDDIYTTGATLDELARTAKAAGARHVYCACICIDEQ